MDEDILFLLVVVLMLLVVCSLPATEGLLCLPLSSVPVWLAAASDAAGSRVKNEFENEEAILATGIFFFNTNANNCYSRNLVRGSGSGSYGQFTQTTGAGTNLNLEATWTTSVKSQQVADSADETLIRA